MPSPVPALDHCPACGGPEAEAPRCPHCGGNLLVDVLLEGAPPDARGLFQLARAVAALGLPGLSFAGAKAALARPDRLLASGLGRGQARALLGALATEGMAGSARPSSPPRSGRPPGIGRALLAGGAVVLLAAGGLATWRLSSSGPPAAPAGQPTAEPTAEPAAPAPTASGAVPPAEATLPTADILKRATPATAHLSCEGKSGAGFFIEEERLLTNAHVVCGPSAGLQVQIGDGRTLLGRVEAQDEWLDWAVVRVPGAGVAPLPLGDVTALTPADPVLIIGAPRGLAGTVHQGKVSFVGRALYGVAYLQLNADVNPGNSGGPVLDARGRAVAIVSIKIMGADGIGMALPVEYARPALAGASQPGAAARERFDELRRKAEAEDAAEVARVRTELAHPVLIDAASSGPRSVVLVAMQRWSGRPGSAALSAEVRHEGQVLCRISATASSWIDLQKQVKEMADPKVERQAAWLLRQGLLADVHAAAAEAELSGCPEPIPSGARIGLQGSESEANWFRMPAATPSTPREQTLWRAREASAASRQRARSERALDEAQWREAFREAKAKASELAARRDRMRRELVAPTDARATAEARRQLPEVESQARQAAEALEELERQASFAGVPREWR